MIPLPLSFKELGVLFVVGMAVLWGYTAVTPGPETIEADSLESQIESNINDARQAEGLPPLAESDRLGQQARSYSQEQARNDFIGHDSPVSGPMSTRLSCRPSGENINTAYYVQEFVSDGEERFLSNESQVADYVVQSWLRSEGHRSNIMNRRFSTQGVGINVTERNGDDFVIVTQQLC
jgi:uncharacterized protein YkwD